RPVSASGQVPCSDDAGLSPELGHTNVGDPASRPAGDVAGEGDPNGAEEQLPDVGDATAHDEALRVEDRCQVGQAAPGPVGHGLQALQGGGVPLQGRLGDGLALDPFHAAVGELEHALGGDGIGAGEVAPFCNQGAATGV